MSLQEYVHCHFVWYLNLIRFIQSLAPSVQCSSSHSSLRGIRIHPLPYFTLKQGGRTWQPFVGGKNGHENFRQALIYNFRNKCVVFARNRKFANLTK